jgi:hypothetical protein
VHPLEAPLEGLGDLLPKPCHKVLKCTIRSSSTYAQSTPGLKNSS